jgi:hypothetical protein
MYVPADIYLEIRTVSTGDDLGIENYLNEN